MKPMNAPCGHTHGERKKRAHISRGAVPIAPNGRVSRARTAHPTKPHINDMGALSGAVGRGQRRNWGAPPLYKRGALQRDPGRATR